MGIPGWPEDEAEPVAQPFVIRDEPSLSSSKPSVKKAKSSESATVWAVVALIGVTVAGYVIVKAGRPAPEPEPAPVVAAPEPEPTPAPRPKRTRPAPKRTTIANPEPAKTRPTIVTHVEPERKVVDPKEGFETGEAFDNPPSPGRYGQRTSGLLERGNPAPRPNAPDPSFGRTPQ